MSNLNDPHELEQEAAEVTLPQGRDGGVDRPERPGQVDPAARGSEEAAEPPPEADAERLESALREGAGFLRIADPLSVERSREETEEGPGTSLG
jgi:hypothetical protein